MIVLRLRSIQVASLFLLLHRNTEIRVTNQFKVDRTFRTAFSQLKYVQLNEHSELTCRGTKRSR